MVNINLIFVNCIQFPDFEGREVQRHVLGEDVDGSLGGSVGPPVGLGLVGGDAADVDHAAVLGGGVGPDVVGHRLDHEAVPGNIHPEDGNQ